MNGGYRYRSDDLARVLAAWGSTLGDQTSAHVEGSVLELRRTWDRRLAGIGAAVALALAAASVLALFCGVVLAYDRFPRWLEMLASLLPAVVVGALGVRAARPRETLIDRSTRTLWSRGVKRSLDPPALVLTRDDADTRSFDVHLALRRGGTVVRLGGVSASEAARTKAIAVALAAWLDGTLVERSSKDTLDALHDADARHGLALARAEPRVAAAPPGPSRASQRIEAVVDVALFSVEMLNAL